MKKITISFEVKLRSKNISIQMDRAPSESFSEEKEHEEQVDDLSEHSPSST